MASRSNTHDVDGELLEPTKASMKTPTTPSGRTIKVTVAFRPCRELNTSGKCM